jgi:arylsulfatase A-like enzyme
MVGEVLACLDRNKLVDNTLVIFTSDNGGMFNIPGQKGFGDGHKLNGELLGFKFGAWEGGHRVPFVVRWPGKVKPGTTSKQLISHIDMLATFAAVTGQQLDPVQRADSVNVLPALVGEPEKALRDHLVLAPAQKTHLSLRKGKWMYLPARNSGGFKGTKPGDHGFAGAAAASFVGSVNSDFEQGRIKKNAPPAQLYDLEADPRQTTNLYRQHPEVVTEMKALLAKHKSPAPKPRAGKNKEP